ncbi:hypothetical protein N7468_005881 [Penicillium chermesinum]|uniref:Uncharacterized protein n=1 Tax=Penicillium chermesinum TaxID=63820 RepID=A0A9W9P0A1_9EURO|nr:uncharacterized protein N7468_005881 [Penicillium chermesinum]KAJ5232925.1 hypothetical protein N7468_005881 [Penicillium chermesinum]
MSSNRPFLANFLAAFRAQSAYKAGASQPTGTTSLSSAQISQNARAIATKAANSGSGSAGPSGSASASASASTSHHSGATAAPATSSASQPPHHYHHESPLATSLAHARLCDSNPHHPERRPAASRQRQLQWLGRLPGCNGPRKVVHRRPYTGR